MEQLKSERYKEHIIKCDKFSNGVKCYVPFQGMTHIAKTKIKALEGVKADIDKKISVRKSKEDGFKTLKFKQLKLFYYKKVSSRNTGMGGTNVKADVYEQKSSGMTKLGQARWNTASYKGEESTVLDFLKSNGKIPKGMFPTGYYGWSDAERYNVKISRL